MGGTENAEHTEHTVDWLLRQLRAHNRRLADVAIRADLLARYIRDEIDRNKGIIDQVERVERG